MSKTNIIPVIMSGGAGTRLWPASRQSTPKQLLPLLSQHTMIQETSQRLNGTWAGVEAGASFKYSDPVIVCGEKHAVQISEQLSKIGIAANLTITEPVARNTAPCAAIAAMAVLAADPDALMLLSPADHHICDKAEFANVVSRGLEAANAGFIVTFGITPTNPETGYGYIQKGEPILGDAFDVTAFKEKPDKKTAEVYISSGQYLWNSGIFMCKPAVLLDEMRRHAPNILAACETAYKASHEQDGHLALDMQTFAACPADSIDYAVMEQTDKAAVVEADMGWSDIGSWSALLKLKQQILSKSDSEAEHEELGNILVGDAHVVDTKNTLVHTDGPFVATLGVENLCVIVHEDAVLVASMDNVQDVKKIVEFLKARGDNNYL